MTNVHQPSPDEIAQLIESDDLIRYVVEGLGGRITAIRDLQTVPVIDTPNRIERRKDTSWRLISALSLLPSHRR